MSKWVSSIAIHNELLRRGRKVTQTFKVVSRTYKMCLGDLALRMHHHCVLCILTFNSHQLSAEVH